MTPYEISHLFRQAMPHGLYPEFPIDPSNPQAEEDDDIGKNVFREKNPNHAALMVHDLDCNEFFFLSEEKDFKSLYMGDMEGNKFSIYDKEAQEYHSHSPMVLHFDDPISERPNQIDEYAIYIIY